MKYFISQPMRGKSNDEIELERNRIVKDIKNRDEHAEVVDSFFKNAPVDTKPMWYLGESIKCLSEADCIVLAPGWKETRGCKIEYECAKEYGLMVWRI